ncbi:bacteriocin biosynthesis protein [Frankia sp. B2]|uniref:thiopeptide-type bacteriocin biosynthesis protein n=1 Tax=unclassified Frankia TaxID=2632575 RepID=UPI0006C9FC6F|nr:MULTISPECIES: thiopeptide-type bacteriocin biosynthesis protein [unclassified Frankia]KPM56938.1 bacteriocin biosynthesis protein [Frankia sp. R43]TFE26204.1 bacteriocin biosynthesis protein [Frankia sp. B2]
MDETAWKQVNITYPGADRHQRERRAVDHLVRVLPAAEADGLLTAWFFIRKGAWRLRYLPTAANSRDEPNPDPVHRVLTDGVRWTPDIYEPEVHAFGGPSSMDIAHALFHHDSRHLLTFLRDDPADRREHSLFLCTALMRAAGLDANEQGDVWARIVEQRPGLADLPADPQVRASFISDVRHFLLGDARADLIAPGWLTAFQQAGSGLRNLRGEGRLTRGIRAIISLHVIFHWNRLGIAATAQATLARAAREALFDSVPGCHREH